MCPNASTVPLHASTIAGVPVPVGAGAGIRAVGRAPEDDSSGLPRQKPSVGKEIRKQSSHGGSHTEGLQQSYCLAHSLQAGRSQYVVRCAGRSCGHRTVASLMEGVVAAGGNGTAMQLRWPIDLATGRKRGAAGEFGGDRPLASLPVTDLRTQPPDVG